MALTDDDRLLWQQRLAHAQGLQAQQKERWEQSLDFVRLQWFAKRFPAELERIEVHWAWSYYNTLIPTLYSKDPHIFTKARQASSVPFSDTMEEVLNYHKDELKMKDAVHRAIGDAVIFGLGWIEVGFLPGFGELPLAEQKDEITSIRKQVEQATRETLGSPEEDEPSSILLPEVREGHLFLRWIPAWRVLLAPGYHQIREMPYLIVIEDIEEEDLRRDPRYNQKVIKRLKPTRLIEARSPGKTLTPQPTISKTAQVASQKPMEFFRLFHVWDRRNLQQFTLAETETEEIFWQEWPTSLDEFMHVPLIFNDTPPSEEDPHAYPTDDITPMKPQLVEKSLLRTSMVKARRRMAPTILVNKEVIPEEEIRKLEENEEALIIPLSDISERAVRDTNLVRLPREIFSVDDTIDRDLNTISGLNQILLSGEAATGDRTATEINQQAQGIALRTGRRVDIIEDFIVELSRRMAAFCWENCTRTEIAEILGKPVSEEMWPELPESRGERKRMIIKELAFRIDAGATQADQIKMVEQNIWLRAINMLKASFPDRFHDDRLIKQFLKKIDMKEIDYIVKTGDAEEQQAAQQENELLMKNIPQIVGPNDLDEVHIPIHNQPIQVSGGQSTPAMDQHILSHAQSRERKNPAIKPQSGDVSTPNQAGPGTAELQRSGGSRAADLLGGGASIQQGLGPETSLAP